MCFDLIVAQDENEKLYLEYNLYVGGIELGYAYSKTETGKEYPYDYAEGGVFGNVFSMSFKEFVVYAEKEMKNYIKENDGYYAGTEFNKVRLTDKEKEPLNCW